MPDITVKCSRTLGSAGQIVKIQIGLMFRDSRTNVLQWRLPAITPPRYFFKTDCPLRDDATFGRLFDGSVCTKEIIKLSSPTEQDVDMIMRPENVELSHSALDLFEDYLDGDPNRTAHEVGRACVALFSTVVVDDFD
jgi:hypothetical protein